MWWWMLVLSIGWFVAFIAGFAAGLFVAISGQSKGPTLGTKVYPPTEQP